MKPEAVRKMDEETKISICWQGEQLILQIYQVNCFV